MRPSCDSDWTKYQDLCYKLIENATNYDTAKGGCEALATDGKLAAPKFPEVQTLLVNFGSTADFWIGLDDKLVVHFILNI